MSGATSSAKCTGLGSLVVPEFVVVLADLVFLLASVTLRMKESTLGLIMGTTAMIT